MWPTACCGVEGEQRLVDVIAKKLVKQGSLELQTLSSLYAQEFNNIVRASPWSHYSENKRNDGSFKKWLRECGFNVGQTYGNQAWVLAPAVEEESWHSAGHSKAIVELANWSIGDSGVVEIFKNETCNVMQVPRICNSEAVHLRCLHLHENKLTDAGVHALVDCLTRNRVRLDVLKLYKNVGIGDAGAAKLSELYGQEQRLPPKELHLSDCSVGSRGASTLVSAIGERWRTAWGRPKAAYVRLDNNPFSAGDLQDALACLNLYVRQAWDQRQRRNVCEVHEGGPALILLAHLSLAYGYQRNEAMASRREAKAVEPMAEPAIFQENLPDPPPDSQGCPIQCGSTVQYHDDPTWIGTVMGFDYKENLPDPPPDSQGCPIQCGSTVQYHDDPNWIDTVMGFDYKGTAIVAWYHGAKRGTRAAAGGRYLRVLESTGAASSQELVRPKEVKQEVKMPWEELSVRLFSEEREERSFPGVQPPEEDSEEDCLGPFPQARLDFLLGSFDPQAAPVVAPPRSEEPRDCEGMLLRKDDSVQYHDDSSWLGHIVGFAKESLAVVQWLRGGKAGKRTFSSGRFLRIVSKPEATPYPAPQGLNRVIGEESRRAAQSQGAWHSLSGLGGFHG